MRKEGEGHTVTQGMNLYPFIEEKLEHVGKKGNHQYLCDDEEKKPLLNRRSDTPSGVQLYSPTKGFYRAIVILAMDGRCDRHT